jgi:cytochrome c-type biogenesis protein
MNNILAFLEGVITFISPCLLPMLPVYITYFAAGEEDGEVKTAERETCPECGVRLRNFYKPRQSKAVINSLGFILGFTMVFAAMGAFAGSLGMVLRGHETIVNIICGIIVVLLGLNFLNVINIPLFNAKGNGTVQKKLNFIKAFIFGVVFSVSWTPCVGVFLGSALMLAAQSTSVIKGEIMLLCFSAGLGIPFLLSAVFIEKLKGAFNLVKRHYKVINAVSGCILLVVGTLIATGTFRSIAYMFN